MASNSERTASNLSADEIALRKVHQFVRNDDFDRLHYHEDWKVRMSRNYYDSLFKEFACVDLSKYRCVYI